MLSTPLGTLEIIVMHWKYSTITNKKMEIVVSLDICTFLITKPTVLTFRSKVMFYLEIDAVGVE